MSHSGCVSTINEEEINYQVDSANVLIITNVDELKMVVDSDKNIDFNPELITLVEALESYDYSYNSEFDYETAAESAYSISAEIKEYGLKPLDGELLKNYGSYKHDVGQANRVIDVLNENMEYTFDRISDTDLTHNNFVKIMDKGQKYLPLVSSYNEFLDSSMCVLEDRNNRDNVRRFYICAFLLATDIAFIQSGGFHRTTFKSVGMISRELKLMKTVPYLGYSGYGLLLSTIYWSLRGYAETLKNDVYEVLRDGTFNADVQKYLLAFSPENFTIDTDNASAYAMENIEKAGDKLQHINLDKVIEISPL